MVCHQEVPASRKNFICFDCYSELDLEVHTQAIQKKNLLRVRVAPMQHNTLTPRQVDVISANKTTNFNINKKPVDLKLNQFIILYEIYFKRPFKVKGPNRIGNLPGYSIPYGSVRYIIGSLTKKGYITTPFSINDGIRKGTTCKVNEEKCRHLLGATSVVNNDQINILNTRHLNTLTPPHFNFKHFS